MKLYDTCVLLNHADDICKSQQTFAISSITINELNSIKESKLKDESVKYAARTMLKWFKNNPDKFTVYLYKNSWADILIKHDVEIINDTKIVVTAFCNDCILVTEDAGCRVFANELSVKTEEYKEEKTEEEYHGYYILQYSDDNMSTFYDYVLPNNKNQYNLLINQYLFIENQDGNIIDKYKWTEDGYQHLYDYKYYTYDSVAFGKLKPRDAYQLCAIDSFNSNKITMIGGPAGSGKTQLALSYLFSKMEHGDIDRIVIFCNPVAARGAAKMGYYPGTRNEKVLGTQVGGILSSKIGDMFTVEKLIEEGKIILIPAADARGYETPAHSGVYIVESQNLTVDLMKLILQRIGEECITIVDGDRMTQTDEPIYAGSNNGMTRMSEVFRGQDCFGQIDLNYIYRSDIAKIAENM